MYKKLLFTSVSAIVLINTQPSLAEETLIDLSDKPITTPTLDYLHEKDASYPENAYTITPGTEDDYSFIAPVADSDGNITNEYYKINFKNTDRITWTPDGDRTLTLNLPNAENPTEYKYTYTMPEGYTETNTRIRNLTSDNAQNVVFKNITYGSQGGAIYSNQTVPNINIVADFLGNSSYSTSIYALGGAIYNLSTISNITGDFIGNYASSKYEFAQGGAIRNNGTIGNITGNFIGNYAEITDPAAYAYVKGGALDNLGTITNITGHFIGNYVSGISYIAQGGAISNTSTITNITGDFIGNHATSEHRSAYGGAIYNSDSGKIGDITGDFVQNFVQSEGDAHGGAIYNYNATINDITGDFVQNFVQSDNYAYGGAIYNYNATINDITGDFIGNLIKSEKEYSEGGAIQNYNATIGDITGNFIGNSSIALQGQAFGGAINNNGNISNINASFIENSAQGLYGVYGGAIDSHGVIDTITGSFIGNYVINGQGGAIHNSGLIGNETIGIKGTFINNKATIQGGAISNDYDGTITSINADFNNNSATSEGSYARGGAIYNEGTISDIINSSFLGNYASGNEESKGGAIYSTKDIKITAQDNGTSEFTGNYVLANGVKSENAIYMDSDSSTLSLNALTNGQILFNDEIDGVEGYKIAIDGDSTGMVTFNNHIRNADITLSNTNMIVDKAEYLGDNDNLLIQSGNLTINSGEMTIKQLGMNTLNFKSLSMPGGLLRVDSLTVDLANQTSGMITADTASGGAGKIKVESVLLTSDGQAGSTPVQFVSEDISKEVTTDVTEALAPIYKYGVEYNNKSGEFVFTRGDLVEPEPEPDTPVDPDTPENPGTPSVPVTPIRPITPAYKAFNPGVFANDVFAMSAMNIQGEVAKKVFDMDTNREYCFGRIWATPFYSDDTLSYSGFYDVDSKNYGLIAGIDTRAFGDYDGWNSVYTLFGAYNDGESKYQGVKVDSKSWLVGLKASVYNGGFYGDAIVNYAWHDSDQKTAFGTDSVDSTGYGAALKAGYKHGFDKVELDTSAMLSWQTIEGDDFTSKSGARISTDDYSRLTLTPQVKLGYSFEKVKPYALVRYNFVLDEDGSSAVNNIALPTIESKDYVEYGLGLETTDAFPHSGYAHVLRHDGGREGWSVTAGYRFNF